MNVPASVSAAASAELHLKMCKKVAQLTKVIFQLNTRNEDYQAEAEYTRTAHTAELQRLTQDAADTMRTLQGKLQTQAATAAQRERQYVSERQKYMNEAQQQQRRSQAGRAAAEEAFRAKVTEFETQVLEAQRAATHSIALEKEAQRVLSSQEESVALEARLEEMRLKHADEVERLVTTSNAKHNKMLAEQLRAQDALKADLVSAKLDFDKQKQEVIAELEQQRLKQEMSAKTSFDTMKHELVTKIEALLVDAETLRGSETKLRDEKEKLLSKTRKVCGGCLAHSDELQRMLAVSTDKIDELAQELSTLKHTLQTRDRALTQAQKDLETAQLETKQQNANASELHAQLKLQLQEHELQLANSKSEIQLAFQQVETVALKSIAELQTDGANDALTRSKLAQELERALNDAKQATTNHEHVIEALKQTHDSKIQQLMSSHTHEMETQRSAAATQLEQLEKSLREASEKSSDEKITEFKREHQRVVDDLEAASKTAQNKFRDEIVQLELQTKSLQDQLTAQTCQLTELQKKHEDLTRQLESSQQQIGTN
ncbi:hypothetical protein PInf_015213 [Phytophthora infestans]|nr:hypothetical protein PInf_015213 [Phytophthora infestans]